MPRIPTYSFEAQRAPSSQSVRVDPGMFNAQAQATQRLGNAVADIGQQAGQLAYNIQRASNFKTETTVQLAMDEEWAKFQGEMNPSTDESKWQEQWEKRLTARVSKETPKDAGPVLKQNLENHIRAFKTRSGAEIGQQAKAVNVEKSKVVGLTKLNNEWAAGEVEAAEARLHKMANLGLIYHEEIPSMVAQGYSTMDKTNVRKLTNDDPIAATQALEEQTAGGKWKNFKHLTEQDRLTSLKTAREETTALRTNTYNGLAERALNNEPPSAEELTGLVERGILTAGQAKTYKRTYLDGQYKATDAEGGALLNDISNYDPTTDASKTEFMALSRRIATEGLPPLAISQAQELLKKKSNPADELNTQAARSANQIIGENFRLGVYGKYQTKVKVGDEWITKTDTKALDEAQKARASVQTAVNQFIKSKPLATEKEIKEVINQADRGYKVDAMWGPIIDENTGMAP